MNGLAHAHRAGARGPRPRRRAAPPRPRAQPRLRVGRHRRAHARLLPQGPWPLGRSSSGSTDASSRGSPTGTGRYLRNLLRHWREIGRRALRLLQRPARARPRGRAPAGPQAAARRRRGAGPRVAGVDPARGRARRRDRRLLLAGLLVPAAARPPARDGRARPLVLRATRRTSPSLDAARRRALVAASLRASRRVAVCSDFTARELARLFPDLARARRAHPARGRRGPARRAAARRGAGRAGRERPAPAQRGRDPQPPLPARAAARGRAPARPPPGPRARRGRREPHPPPPRPRGDRCRAGPRAPTCACPASSRIASSRCATRPRTRSSRSPSTRASACPRSRRPRAACRSWSDAPPRRARSSARRRCSWIRATRPTSPARSIGRSATRRLRARLVAAGRALVARHSWAETARLTREALARRGGAMSEAPTVAVVIVSFETRDHPRSTASRRSRANAGLAIETVVVDNASHDGSARGRPRRASRGVRVVANAQNVGFARACNQGVARDARPARPVPEPRRHARARARSPRSRRSSSRARASGSRGRARAAPTATSRSRPAPTSRSSRNGGSAGSSAVSFAATRARSRRPRPDTPSSTSPTGSRERACWRGARPSIAVGGFDERFFLYEEDADLCRRVRAAGWQVVFTPTAEVRHARGLSMARAPRARPPRVPPQPPALLPQALRACCSARPLRLLLAGASRSWTSAPAPSRATSPAAARPWHCCAWRSSGAPLPDDLDRQLGLDHLARLRVDGRRERHRLALVGEDLATRC